MVFTHNTAKLKHEGFRSFNRYRETYIKGILLKFSEAIFYASNCSSVQSRRMFNIEGHRGFPFKAFLDPLNMEEVRPTSTHTSKTTRLGVFEKRKNLSSEANTAWSKYQVKQISVGVRGKYL